MPQSIIKVLMMKTEIIKAILLGLVSILLLVALEARADTNNVKMAWDFRTNSWRTIEFLSGRKNIIKVYATKEDVTKMVTFREIKGKYIFIIKEKNEPSNKL